MLAYKRLENNPNCKENVGAYWLEKAFLFNSRPNHGFRRHLDGQAKRSEIRVFVWESDGRNFFKN